MLFERVSVTNYKSISSVELELRPGLNVLVGANNAGKTSILECLRLQDRSVPHRSVATIPKEGRSPAEGKSKVTARVRFPYDDVTDYLETISLVCMPAPAESGANAHDAMAAFDEWFRSGRDLYCDVEINGANGFISIVDPAFGLYHTVGHAGGAGTVGIVADDDGRWLKHGGGGDPQRWLAMELLQAARRRIQFLSHDRRAQVSWPDPVEGGRLSDNALNLVGVLETLQATPKKFEQFKWLVRQVLPEIDELSVAREKAASIRLWFRGVPADRADLAVALSDCGAGVGQVLTLVTVAMGLLRDPIIVDEPQAHLHPGAFKRLMALLSTSSRSQVIIATHSPTALLRHASTVHLVHLDQGETHIRLLDMKDGDDVRATLQRLGASASDFFGAEAVIWVEGRTEQSALPLVMAHFSREFPELARSALVAAVPSPDTIDRASKERTIRHLLQLYERVSGGHALLPPALAFLLDREQRSPERQLELAKCRAGSFAFTERRMFENYLIVPRAVCSIMVEEARLWNVEGFALDEASVNSQLEAADLLNGHGANLLSGVFSAHQLKYDKVRHGTQLVRWLLENDPLKLRGLAEQLDCCIRGVAPLPKIAR